MLRISVSSGVITRPAKNDGYVDSVSLHGSDYESMKDLEPRIRIIPFISNRLDSHGLDLDSELSTETQGESRVSPCLRLTPKCFPRKGRSLRVAVVKKGRLRCVAILTTL